MHSVCVCSPLKYCRTTERRTTDRPALTDGKETKEGKERKRRELSERVWRNYVRGEEEEGEEGEEFEAGSKVSQRVLVVRENSRKSSNRPTMSDRIN